MKSLRFLTLLALLLVATSAHADDWLTDFKQAQQKAKSDNKLLLLDFTGSDWCGWCIKLHREVFSKPEFKDYAMKNLVLMEVDFPRAQVIKPELQRQNEELAMKFGIQGFPTIVVMNGEGKVLGALSYDAGIPGDQSQRGEPKATPQAFIASLEKLRKS